MGNGAAAAPGRTVIIPAIAPMPMPAPPGPGTCPRTHHHVSDDCNQCLQRLHETKTHLRLPQPRGEGLPLLPRGRPRGLEEGPEQQVLHHRQLPRKTRGRKRSEDGFEPGVDLLIYPHLVEDLPLEQPHEAPAHLFQPTKRVKRTDTMEVCSARRRSDLAPVRHRADVVEHRRRFRERRRRLDFLDELVGQSSATVAWMEATVRSVTWPTLASAPAAPGCPRGRGTPPTAPRARGARARTTAAAHRCCSPAALSPTKTPSSGSRPDPTRRGCNRW